MRQLFLLFLTSVIGSSVLAQPMLVRSGEHVGFTRIVIDAGPKAKWSAKHSGKLVELNVEGGESSFDLTQVYKRIKQDRVQSIDQSGDTLLLELTCDCSVSVFDSAPGMIVADIASPGTELDTPVIAPEPIAAEPPQPSETRKFTKATPVNNDILAGLSRRSESTAMFQAAIAQDIGSLGTQGILQKSKPIGPTSGMEKVPPPTLKLGKHLLSEFRNVKIGTSIEEKLAQQNNINPADCRDSTPLANLGEAIVSGDFSKYQGSNAAIDVKQQDETVRILDLLHNGLGAEAAQLLAYYEGSNTEISFLQLISDLFEYGRSDSLDQISSHLNCTPNLKIWALATYNGDGSDLKPEDVKEGLLSFSEFPRHLRNIVHPLLEEVVIRAGLESSTIGTSNEIAASFPDLLQNLSMSAEKSDFTDIFANDLQKKEDSTPSIHKTTKSLALAVENTIERGQPATLQDMKIIDMEAFDAVGTDDEGRLTELKLSALLSRGEFYDAYDLLARQKRADYILIERMANTMFDNLATDASDVELLELSMPVEKRFSDLLNPSIIDKIQDRQNNIMASIGDAEAPRLETLSDTKSVGQERGLASPQFQTGPNAELASQSAPANGNVSAPSPEETLNAGKEFRDSLEDLIREN
jgi:hypothetical protein